MPSFEFGRFQLREATRELLRDGVPLRTEPRVHDLLAYLIRHRDRVVPTHELLTTLWQGTTVTRGSLTRAVRLARETLGDVAREPIWVATVWGHGYRFVGDAREAMPDVLPSPRPSSEASGSAPRVQGFDALVGRESELQQLLRSIHSARSSGGRLCLITGEPGIGKTRLAREAARRAACSGWKVLSAWCHDGEGTPSYWPWIQLLRAHAREADVAQLRADLGPALDLVAQTIPDLQHVLQVRARLAEPPPDDARFYLFDAITRMFLEAARRTPLLLLVDDLHSSDTPSLRLLEFFSREITKAPLLVLGTHRCADIDLSDRFRQMLGEIERHGHCERMSLDGLGEPAVAALVAAAGLQRDAAWVERVHRRTGGNAFFVRELIRSAASDVRAAHDRIPPAARDVIQAQVDRLSPRCAELLRVASIVATEWSLDLVRGVSGLAPAAFSETLHEALASGLIHPTERGGTAAFAHALIRETLYADIPTPRRQQLHRGASDWLEAQAELDLAEVAHHAAASAALDGGKKARAYSMRAAEAAASRLAYEDAATHYQRALALLEPSTSSELRCTLQVGLAEAQLGSGDREQATRSFWAAARIALELRSGSLVARIALGLAPGLLSLEIVPARAELVSLLRDALELCTDDLALASRLRARLALALMWSAPRAETEALVERALEEARRCGDATAEAFAAQARLLVRWSPENLAERLSESAALLACTLRLRDRSLEVVCRVTRFCSLLEASDLPALRLELEAFDRLADEVRQPQAFCQRLMLRACIAALEGRYGEFAQLRTELLETGRSVHDENVFHAAGTLDIVLAWEEGRFDDAVAISERGSRVFSAWRNPGITMLAECGRRAEAHALLRSLFVEGRLALRRDILWHCHIVNVAETCTVLGDVELARIVYDELLPYRDRTLVMGYGWGVWGSAERTLGTLAALLEDWDTAEEHFEAALRANRKLCARAMVVRTEYGYASMLLARDRDGDRSRAQHLIASASAEARVLGLADLTERLAKLRT